jgi:hypothetical protein
MSHNSFSNGRTVDKEQVYKETVAYINILEGKIAKFNRNLPVPEACET